MATSAWCLLGFAAVLLRLVPFRIFAPLLGRPIGAAACVPLVDQRQERTAIRIHRAVSRAAQLAPLRADCLPQAFAGAILSRILRVPGAVHLGVALDPKRAMSAHAWLVSGRIAVTGGSSFGEFTVVSCFVSESG